MSKARSGGCGLVLGLLLVIVGSLLLGANLFGFSLHTVWTRALMLFGRYWPVILVLWGAHKIYQRFAHPEESRVRAGEVFLLILLVLAGLSIRTVQFFAADAPFDEVMDAWFPPVDFGPAQRFTEEQRFPLTEGRVLRVENDRGTITVEAWDETDLKVVLTKRVRVRSEDEARRLSEDVTLRFEAGGSNEPARLSAGRGDGRPRERVETDLEVWIPRKSALTVANNRGAVRVVGLRAPVAVSTAYDTVEIEDIVGRVQVDGRHGPLRILNVTGNVEARNRFDLLKISEVKGDVEAEAANGELDVEDVSGNARLENRYSRVHAARVKGDVVVEAANTEVSVEDAGASVSIETSFQSIFVQRVQGRLKIDGRNSEIEVRDVKGDLDLANRFRSVTVSGVTGAVVMNAEQCEVHLEDVTGPVRITGSYQPIEVSGFRGTLNVTTQHAPVTVSSGVLAGEVKIATSYGSVRLALPPSAGFRLQAKTEQGRVQSEFPDQSWQRRTMGRNEEVTGVAGSGAVPVTVETSFGNIELVKLPHAEAEEEGRK